MRENSVIKQSPVKLWELECSGRYVFFMVDDGIKSDLMAGKTINRVHLPKKSTDSVRSFSDKRPTGETSEKEELLIYPVEQQEFNQVDIQKGEKLPDVMALGDMQKMNVINAVLPAPYDELNPDIHRTTRLESFFQEKFNTNPSYEGAYILAQALQNAIGGELVKVTGKHLANNSIHCWHILLKRGDVLFDHLEGEHSEQDLPDIWIEDNLVNVELTPFSDDDLPSMGFEVLHPKDYPEEVEEITSYLKGVMETDDLMEPDIVREQKIALKSHDLNVSF